MRNMNIPHLDSSYCVLVCVFWALVSDDKTLFYKVYHVLIFLKFNQSLKNFHLKFLRQISVNHQLNL